MYSLYLFIINIVQNSNETYQLPQFPSLHWSFVSHKNHHEHSLSNYSLKRNKLFCEQKMHYTQLKAQLGFFFLINTTGSILSSFVSRNFIDCMDLMTANPSWLVQQL